jgi:hypothetical protein
LPQARIIAVEMFRGPDQIDKRMTDCINPAS